MKDVERLIEILSTMDIPENRRLINFDNLKKHGYS